MASAPQSEPIAVAAADVENLEPIVPRQRKVDDGEMDITPMIDCVFLLLIFFIVTSKMEDAATVSLPIARHGGSVSSKDSVVVLVTPGDADKAIVAREDGLPFSPDLATQEREIGEYVEAGLNGGPPFDSAKHHVLIKAAKGIKHKEVARVAKAIGLAADLPTLNIAVLEVQ